MRSPVHSYRPVAHRADAIVALGDEPPRTAAIVALGDEPPRTAAMLVRDVLALAARLPPASLALLSPGELPPLARVFSSGAALPGETARRHAPGEPAGDLPWEPLPGVTVAVDADGGLLLSSLFLAPDAATPLPCADPIDRHHARTHPPAPQCPRGDGERPEDRLRPLRVSGRLRAA